MTTTNTRRRTAARCPASASSRPPAVPPALLAAYLTLRGKGRNSGQRRQLQALQSTAHRLWGEKRWRAGRDARNQARQFARQIRSTRTVSLPQLRRELRSLLAHPFARAVCIQSGILDVSTCPRQVVSDFGWPGSFRFHIRIAPGKLQQPIAITVSPEGRLYDLGIYAGGHACLGDIRRAARELLATGQYAALVLLLLEFLEQRVARSWGVWRL